MRHLKDSISVLMPTYNFEDMIEDNLMTVIRQELDYPLYIHCFDDCSTDGTPDILRKIEAAYPEKVKVYTNEKNLGSGMASFRHHRPKIDTKYWCILEGDDHWCATDKLKKQINVLENDPTLVACTGNTVIQRNKQYTEEIIYPRKARFNLMDMVLLGSRVRFYTHTSSIVWRNIYFKKDLPFPEKFYGTKGDPALMRIMLEKGHSVFNIDATLSAYNVTGSGRWSSLSDEEQKKRNAAYKNELEELLPLNFQIARYILKYSSLHKRSGEETLYDKFVKFTARLFSPLPIN